MESPWTAASLERVRRLAVDRVTDGYSPAEVAEFLHVSERSVWRWLATVRSVGDAGLDPKPGRGQPPKLSPAQAAATLGFLDRSPTEFGFATERWTAPQVARVVERELGVRMNHRYLNDWLRRRVGVTPQVPETRARERDEAGIARWLRWGWPRIKKTPATATRTSCLPMNVASC